MPSVQWDATKIDGCECVCSGDPFRSGVGRMLANPLTQPTHFIGIEGIPGLLMVWMGAQLAEFKHLARGSAMDRYNQRCHFYAEAGTCMDSNWFIGWLC